MLLGSPITVIHLEDFPCHFIQTLSVLCIITPAYISLKWQFGVRKYAQLITAVHQTKQSEPCYYVCYNLVPCATHLYHVGAVKHARRQLTLTAYGHQRLKVSNRDLSSNPDSTVIPEDNTKVIQIITSRQMFAFSSVKRWRLVLIYRLLACMHILLSLGVIILRYIILRYMTL